MPRLFERANNVPITKGKIIRLFLIGFIIILLLILIFSSFVTVGSGNVGVVTRMGAVQPNALGEGFSLKIPLITNVIQMSVRTQKAEADCTAASRDLQTITAKVAVNYHVLKESATMLYKNVGAAYEPIVIMPTIQESVKKCTAQYSAEELITRRQDLSDQIKSELSERLLGYGIYIDAMNILDLNFSEEFNKAIEAKQTAQQNALKAEQDLNRIKVEAQQKVEQAKAEAEAIKAKADADAYAIQKLQEQLAKDPLYIHYAQIQKWDGKLPIVTGSDGNILDIGSILGQASSASDTTQPSVAP